MNLVPDVQIDFVIAGVQKAGTTALAQYLSQHPKLFLPLGKETHYFKRSLTPSGPSERSIDRLNWHYLPAPRGARLGDATPIYTYWPYSLELLKAHNRDIKIIVSLRHPVMRAWSAWSMEYRRGRETLSFGDAVREGRARVTNGPRGVHHVFSYVERGFYAQQVERIFSLFNREQLFFLRNDHIQAAHQQLTDLQTFLDVEPRQFETLKENVNPSSLPLTDDLLRDFDYLQSLYVDDIKATGALTQLELSDWLETPQILGHAS